MMIASEIGARSAANAVVAAAVLFRRGQFIEVDRRYASIYDSLRRLAYEASADLEHGYKISQTTQSMDVWATFPTMDRARFFGGLEPALLKLFHEAGWALCRQLNRRCWPQRLPGEQPCRQNMACRYSRCERNHHFGYLPAFHPSQTSRSTSAVAGGNRSVRSRLLPSGAMQHIAVQFSKTKPRRRPWLSG